MEKVKIWNLAKVLLLTILVGLLLVSYVSAKSFSISVEGAAVRTDKSDYTPGETVTIYGSDFKPNVSVTITLTRPDGHNDIWNVTSDSSGSFTTTYQLDGIKGTYTVTATDGTNTASTSFTDSITENLNPNGAGDSTVLLVVGASTTSDRVPTDDGDISGTWNTAPRWDDVDEITPDDSDYMTGTDGGYCLFTFTAFDVPAGSTIEGLTVYIRARDQASNNSNTVERIKVNGSYYVGSPTHDPSPSNWTTYSYTWTTNPNTAAAWTVADINGTGSNPLQQIGVASDGNPDTLISMVYAEVTYIATPNWEACRSSDGDTSYVYWTTSGATWHDDLYALPDPGLTGDITSVTVYMEAARDDYQGTKQDGAKTAIMTHSTTYYGTEEELTRYSQGGYVTYSTTYLTNPNTTSAWTWDEVNDLEAGVSLRSSGSGTASVMSRCTHVWVVVDYTPPNTGWKNPTANAADTGGDGNGFESNPTRAYADGAPGNAFNDHGAGDRHRYYDYGLTIPAGATITGIEVRLDWWLDGTSGTNSMSVELSWNGGTNWTSAKPAITERTSDGNPTDVLGSSSDTWGRSWTVDELSNENFRVRLTCNSSSSSRDFYLDWVPARVYYTSAPTTVDITITSSPATGAGFVKVDDTPITTSQIFTWTIGSTHTLEALSPVSGGAGIKYVWTSWSDGGDQTHNYTVPNSDQTVTATYQTQYLVTYAANVPVTVPDNEWVVSGQPATGVFPAEEVSDGTKYVYQGDDRPVTITAPTTITATYQNQYLVTYAADAPVTLPSDEWVVSGQPATGVFPAEETSDGTKYVYQSDDRPDTITAPTTVTATYQTQYLVTYAANAPVTLPSDEWVISGQPATGVFPAEEISDGTTYVYQGDDRPVTITAPTTITATYQTQYYLTVTSPYGLPTSGEGWYDDGDTAYAGLSADTGSGAPGTQYVFDQWSNDASGSDYSQSDPITMDGPKTAVADWKTQYCLTMATNFGTTSPSVGEHWYDAGTPVEISATPPSVVDGERYVWNGWTGTGTISYTGADNPAVGKVTMNGPITETASWTHQYYLTVTSPHCLPTSGEGWYDADTAASISTDQYFNIVPGSSRYRFDGWTTGDMSEIANPSSASTTVLMDKPKTVTANWKTQYQVTFDQTGLDGTATGTVVTVGGVTKVKGDLPLTDWFDSGTTYSYSSTVSSTTSGKRFVLTGVTGPSSPITTSGTVTGTYKTQYYLELSTNYGTVSPDNGWHDAGSDVSIEATAPSTVDGERYVWQGWNGVGTDSYTGMNNPASVTMNGPVTETASWTHQYRLTMDTNLGDTTPSVGDNWFDAGTVVEIEANLPSGVNENYYIWLGWTGTGTISYSGTDNPSSVTMNGPITENALWDENENQVSGWDVQENDFVEKGAQTVMEFDNVGVDSITFTANENLENIQIIVQDTVGQPAGISIGPTGNPYRYFEITLVNLDENKIENITLTFKVEKSWISANSIDESMMTLNRWDDTTDTWTSYTATKIGEDDNYSYFSVNLPGLSTFSVAGSTIVTPAPTPTSPPAPSPPTGSPSVLAAQFMVQSLSITPKLSMIGDTVTISINVVNTGAVEGTKTITLRIDGVEVGSSEVSLAPGESRSITFTVTASVAGIHEIEILGGTFSVVDGFGIQAPATTPTPPAIPWIAVSVVIVVAAAFTILLYLRTIVTSLSHSRRTRRAR